MSLSAEHMSPTRLGESGGEEVVTVDALRGGWASVKRGWFAWTFRLLRVEIERTNRGIDDTIAGVG